MLWSCAVQVRKLYLGALEKTHLFLRELMNKIMSRGCFKIIWGRCRGVSVCVGVSGQVQVYMRVSVCVCVCVWGRCRGVCLCDL